MRIKLEDGAYMPTRAHDTDAGLDLYAREDKVVPAGGSAVFDTGIHIQLESVCVLTSVKVDVSDYFPLLKLFKKKRIKEVHIKEFYNTAGFLKSKSGLMVHHDITSDGTIDFSYRGSIIVKLFNHGTEDYQVHRGDKISQLVILPVLTPRLEIVNELDETDRGDKGFGSTGR